MIARSKLFSQKILTVLPAIFLSLLCGLVLCASTYASGEKPRKQHGSEAPIHIEVQDAQGVKIAATDTHTAKSAATSAALTFERAYQPGDHILVGGQQRIAVRFDETMPECLLYLADPAQGSFSYPIPYGRDEQQTGSAYSPESFVGQSHHITARTVQGAELTGYRNLALNPCDVVLPLDQPSLAFPHSSTDSYSRNAFDFAAKNAIDGVVQNGHHGLWPYESWGPGLRLDMWWKLDFGRPVELDKIRLMVRADFPHDSYWKSAVVEFSDGSRLPIDITSSAAFQDFSFSKRQVSWLRITNLVPADPTKWCSFIEVEAWGHDLQ